MRRIKFPKLPKLLDTLIKHCLTGIDGQTYDLARVSWFFGSIFYLAMTAWNVLHKGLPFDYINWSIGFGTIMGAAGVTIKLKQDTEPGQNTSSQNG